MSFDYTNADGMFLLHALTCANGPCTTHLALANVASYGLDRNSKVSRSNSSFSFKTFTSL